MFSRCATLKHLVMKALFFFLDPSKFEAIMFVLTPCQGVTFPRTDVFASERSKNDDFQCQTSSKHEQLSIS